MTTDLFGLYVDALEAVQKFARERRLLDARHPAAPLYLKPVEFSDGTYLDFGRLAEDAVRWYNTLAPDHLTRQRFPKTIADYELLKRAEKERLFFY